MIIFALFIHPGYAPACQLEIGQQKGGNYFCWGFSMKATRNDDMAYMFYAEKLNLDNLIDKIIETTRFILFIL